MTERGNFVNYVLYHDDEFDGEDDRKCDMRLSLLDDDHVDGSLRIICQYHMDIKEFKQHLAEIIIYPDLIEMFAIFQNGPQVVAVIEESKWPMFCGIVRNRLLGWNGTHEEPVISMKISKKGKKRVREENDNLQNVIGKELKEYRGMLAKYADLLKFEHVSEIRRTNAYDRFFRLAVEADEPGIPSFETFSVWACLEGRVCSTSLRWRGP